MGELLYMGSMDSCSKGPKRFCEFESICRSGQHEALQIETDRAGAKRQCRALENTGDDFEEFVALLDRIQYMKTYHMNLGFSEKISLQREDSDVKAMKTKSPWVPSFEWEDFSGFAAKDTMLAQSHSTKDNPSRSYEEKEKESSQPATNFNMRSSSVDKRPAESFDLNVEASSDHTIPALGF